jgi:hypothetical protein
MLLTFETIFIAPSLHILLLAIHWQLASGLYYTLGLKCKGSIFSTMELLMGLGSHLSHSRQLLVANASLHMADQMGP